MLQRDRQRVEVGRLESSLAVGPLLTGKSFGVSSAGKNFGLIVLGAACNILGWLYVVEPFVYEAHTKPGAATCVGAECFATTHYVAATLGSVAFLVSLGFDPSPPPTMKTMA